MRYDIPVFYTQNASTCGFIIIKIICINGLRCATYPYTRYSGHLGEVMSISKLRLTAPRAATLKAIALVLLAMAILETVRIVLFRTILLDQPVARTATVASMCAVLVKLIQQVMRYSEQIRVLRIAGIVFAGAGSFVGYLPAVMVFGRPAFAHIAATEFVAVIVGASAGLVCFVTISSRSWRRPTAARKITLS
jgi:dolichyl-phosphate-mannose--protein O-mannosyl transferase